jgi:hypothetical protein
MQNEFNTPAIVSPAEDLAGFLATANAEHEAGQRAELASLEHYRKAGEALLKAKAAAGHGNWLEALKKTAIPQQGLGVHAPGGRLGQTTARQ